MISMHFLPLLMLVAAYSTRTRLARLARLVAVVLLGTAAVNNWRQFNEARDIITERTTKLVEFLNTLDNALQGSGRHQDAMPKLLATLR